MERADKTTRNNGHVLRWVMVGLFVCGAVVTGRAAWAADSAPSNEVPANVAPSKTVVPTKTVVNDLPAKNLPLKQATLSAAASLKAEASQERTAVKQLQGTVSIVNARGIAVEYAKTEDTAQEMYLPFDAQPRLGGVTRLADLQPGDTVAVEYREVLSKNERGEYANMRRAATGVTLIAQALPSSADAPAEAVSHAKP